MIKVPVFPSCIFTSLIISDLILRQPRSVLFEVLSFREFRRPYVLKIRGFRLTGFLHTKFSFLKINLFGLILGEMCLYLCLSC